MSNPYVSRSGYRLSTSGWVMRGNCFVSYFGGVCPPWAGWEENQKNAMQFIEALENTETRKKENKKEGGR